MERSASAANHYCIRFANDIDAMGMGKVLSGKLSCMWTGLVRGCSNYWYILFQIEASSVVKAHKSSCEG